MVAHSIHFSLESSDENNHTDPENVSNGCLALPHSEVEVREFYKYIEQSLPEQRRMKQLLTWCGSRALPEKPSGTVKDTNVIMAGEWESLNVRFELRGMLIFMSSARNTTGAY